MLLASTSQITPPFQPTTLCSPSCPPAHAPRTLQASASADFTAPAVGAESNRGGRTDGVDTDCGGDDENGSGRAANRVPIAETARMFTLVCSNEEERHAVSTTFRHRFRLEMQTVMKERRNRNREAVGAAKCVDAGMTDQSSSARSKTELMGSHGGRDGACSRSGHLEEWNNSETSPRPDDEEPFKTDDERGRGSTVEGRAGDGCRDDQRGITAEEFTEALLRCPEMIEAFGSQLVARLRYRHRPVWMAPILRAGGAGGVQR